MAGKSGMRMIVYEIGRGYSRSRKNLDRYLEIYAADVIDYSPES